MTKEEWKEELSGVWCHHVSEEKDMVDIKITDIPPEHYGDIVGRGFVSNWNENYSDWILNVECYYNTETGDIEYDGELVADGKINYTSLDMQDEVKQALDEIVKLFYKQREKAWKVFFRLT